MSQDEGLVGRVLKRIDRDVFQDKPDWVGPKILKYLLSNPTFSLTLLYLCVSGLGLLFEFVLFKKFGVNVLDYSEAADFFLAAFKRPEAYILSLSIVGTIVFYRIIANYVRKIESVWIRVTLYFVVWIGLLRREILIPIGTVYFFIFYVSFAGIEANRLVATENTIVTVTTRFGGPLEYQLIPIGTTERFLFGIEHTAELVDWRKESVSMKKSIKPLVRAIQLRKSIKPLVRAIPFSNITKIEYNVASFKL